MSKVKFKTLADVKLAKDKIDKKEQEAEKLRQTRDENPEKFHSLGRDLAELKSIKNIDSQIPVKRVLLESSYFEKMAKALTFGDALEEELNDGVAWSIIFLFDTEMIKSAVFYGALAVEKGYQMPNEFKKDLLNFVVGSFTDFLLKNQHKIDEFQGEIFTIQRLAEGRDIIKGISAELNKICGLVAENAGKLELALSYYQEAVKLDEKIGVKARITALEKEIAALASGRDYPNDKKDNSEADIKANQ